MNVKMTQALLLSLLFHLVLVLLWVWSQSHIKPIIPTPPLEKKELILSDFTRYAPKPTQNNPSQVQEKTQTTKPQQPYIQPKIKQPSPPKHIPKIPPKTTNTNSLANALMQQGQSFKSQNTDNKTQNMIQTLYGNSFNSFTPTQKKFITNNLSTIHRITQNTLTANGYPELALRTMQQGVNVVAFDLHPNGDITNLRLKRPMGYKLLDENTLHVIKIAYKNYPRPKTTTTIMFYVEYRIGY